MRVPLLFFSLLYPACRKSASLCGGVLGWMGIAWFRWLIGRSTCLFAAYDDCALWMMYLMPLSCYQLQVDGEGGGFGARRDTHPDKYLLDMVFDGF